MNQELPGIVKKAALGILVLLALFIVGYMLMPAYPGAEGPDGLTLVVFGPVAIGVVILFALAFLAARLFRVNSLSDKSQPGRRISSRAIAILIAVCLIAIAVGVIWLIKAPLVGP